MSHLMRSIQKIFCNDVSEVGNVAVFGSLKDGTSQYSKDPAIIQQLPAFGEGWKGAVLFNNSPALQDMNAVQYVLSRNLAYLYQAGLPEYSLQETYYQFSYAMYGGFLTQCVAYESLGQNPVLSNDWKVVSSQRIYVVYEPSYEVMKFDNTIVVINSAGQTSNVLLPEVNIYNMDCYWGLHFTIKSLCEGSLILSSGQLIDGLNSIRLSLNESITVTWCGSTWGII